MREIREWRGEEWGIYVGFGVCGGCERREKRSYEGSIDIYVINLYLCVLKQSL